MAHSNKRISKRRYSEVLCKQCNLPFTPTDARQKFCTTQHRIDYHNDKRKIEDKPYKDFKHIHKNNYKTLVKIYYSPHYQSYQVVDESFLTLEDFQHNHFHERGVSIASGRFIYYTFDLGIEFIGNENNKIYKIHKK
jgi:hypothetical protein